MTRAKRLTKETMEPVEVGHQDPVSRAARAANVPLCAKKHPKRAALCTRSAGHDESHPGHPSTPHVAADRGYVAKAVWS